MLLLLLLLKSRASMTVAVAAAAIRITDSPASLLPSLLCRTFTTTSTAPAATVQFLHPPLYFLGAGRHGLNS